MFTSALKILTLCSVLLHAGMGCCAHHEHSESAKSCGAEAAELPQQKRCSCRFHGHDVATPESSDSRETPCDDKYANCNDHCFWLTNSRVELPESFGKVLPRFTVDGCKITAVGSTLFARSQSSEPVAATPSASLRAELQVWRV